MSSYSGTRLNGYFRILVLALSIAASLAAAPAVAQRILLDKIIAIVDEDVVLQSELNERMTAVRQAAIANEQAPPPEDEMRDEVLEALILENLQMQLAERVSIRYDDDTINRVLENMAQNANMSFDEYVSTLEASGVYLQTRENVRKQMSMQELQRGMVNQRITITEQEIDNFLNSEMGREVMSADYLLNHILVPAPATDSTTQRADKLAYAADLVARIEEGEDFLATRTAAQQARNFPVEGTEFGWRKAAQLPRIFTEVVESMSVGEVEGPIEAGNGYHIIQLADKRGGTEQMVKQTNIRHIMLTPNEIRDEEETRQQILELRQQILDGADFADLARQNSDDANSVVGGGDLDWINEGGAPPAMQAVVDQLEVGELSEPFRTDVGWHIAEVLGRRTEDLGQIYTRNQASNALRNRKFNLELQNWLIEIREDAFVELVD
jgi:peptidyl-prolyl cis-trans isomerase SurA